MRSRPDCTECAVPRYFFHLRNGDDVLIDPDGRDIVSLAEVAAITLREARDIISHDALEGCIRLDFRLDIQNAVGGIVHSLAFRDAITVMLGGREKRID